MVKLSRSAFCGAMALFSLFGAQKIHAQAGAPGTSTAYQKPLLPHSPEASAFGKFGDIPVGLHTGIPNISVPVYKFSLKGLELPISIDYHSSGVKVDELASNVGLDWSLNYGGMINLIPHGLNDFGPDGWLSSAANLKTPQSGQLMENWDGFQNFPTDNTYQYLKLAAEGTIDTEPDFFAFSFAGKSGKFFFDQNKGIHFMPHQNLKVEYVLDGQFILSFTITDERGNKFLFADIENTTTKSVGCSGTVGSINNSSSNSYYLSKITTANQEQITFNYTNKIYNIKNPSSIVRYRRTDLSSPGIGACSEMETCLTTSTSKVSGIRISSIVNETTKEKVSFTYDAAGRLDVPGNERLQKIEVLNKDNVLITQFDLTHDYFYSAAPNSPNPEDFRLKLLNVKERGKPAYLFEYNTTALPSRFSSNQDHWGYYNGIKGNVNLLPIDVMRGFPTGANREPDAVFMKAGVLNKVTYPTGGSTVFNYEANDSYTVKRVSKVLQEGAGLGAELNSIVSVKFTIPFDATNFSGQWQTVDGDGSTGGVGQNGVTRITITGPNGFREGFTGNSNGVVSFHLSSVKFVAGQEYTITISNRTTDEVPIGVISIFWERTVYEDIAQNMLAGGLRVNSITDYPVEGPSKTKYFEYTDVLDGAKSSGVLMFDPFYTFEYFKRQMNIDDHVAQCTYVAQQANSLTPLGTVQGGNVIYKNVNVYDNNKQNGYTSNEFETNGNRFGQGPTAAFPFPPLINNDWLNGLPLKTTTYKYNSATEKYFPLQVNEKEYKMAIGEGPNESVVRGIKVGYTFSEFSPSPLVLNPATFRISYYNLYASWFHLDKEKTTIYDQQGNNPLTSITNYYYDNPQHIQTTRTASQKSDGLVKTSTSLYPDDYASGTPFIDQMKANHQVGYPIEQVSYQTSSAGVSILDGKLTEYKASGKALADKVYSLDVPSALNLGQFKFSNKNTDQLNTGGSPSNYSPDSRYRQLVQFNDYDGAGNPLSLEEKSGISSAYQWGYNQKYLVAECKNATQNEFFFEDFENTTNSGPSFTGKRSSGGAYTVNWTRPNNRNYQISYWYYDGTKWQYKKEPYVSGSLALSGGTAYDQVRIYPADAQMTTYTYDQLIGLTSMSDAKGMTSFYLYDEFNRLKLVKDQDGNIVKANEYHYKP